MYGEGKEYPRVCVSAAILNSKGEFLVTKRSESVWYPGTWCLPGGHVNGGEDWITSLRKEVLEEVGLVIEDEVLSGIYSDPALLVLEDPQSKERRHFVVANFLVKKFSGVPQLSSEISDWGWFSLNALPEKIIPIESVKCQDAFHFSGFPVVR